LGGEGDTIQPPNRRSEPPVAAKSEADRWVAAIRRRVGGQACATAVPAVARPEELL